METVKLHLLDEAENSNIVFAVQAANGSEWYKLSWPRLVSWLFQMIAIKALKFKFALTADDFTLDEDSGQHYAAIAHSLATDDIQPTLWTATGYNYPTQGVVQRIDQNTVRIWISDLSDAQLSGTITAIL